MLALGQESQTFGKTASLIRASHSYCAAARLDLFFLRVVRSGSALPKMSEAISFNSWLPEWSRVPPVWGWAKQTATERDFIAFFQKLFAEKRQFQKLVISRKPRAEVRGGRFPVAEPPVQMPTSGRACKREWGHVSPPDPQPSLCEVRQLTAALFLVACTAGECCASA